MTRRLPTILALMSLAFSLACSQSTGSKTSKDGSVSVRSDLVSGAGQQAQVRFGEDEDPWGQLSFSIKKIHSNRKLLSKAPWHTEGGEWTMLDCQLPDGLAFLVGVKERGGKRANIAWGSAFIAVADKATGEKFVQHFAKAFFTKAPPVNDRGPLEPKEFGTAILGKRLGRDPGGGFGGTGNWVASKWFPELDGTTAEVFFNYNQYDGRGEFSEKDPGYRKDLVSLLATFLRDGVPPPRTPASDPNLTDKGPHFESFSDLKQVRFIGFSQSGLMILASAGASRGNRAWLAKPEALDKEIPLVELEHTVDAITCIDAEATRCLVTEGIHAEAGVWSSTDPSRLWWIERSKKTKQMFQGPWDKAKSMAVSAKSISPDGRFVVVQQWEGTAVGKKTRDLQIFFHDITKKTTQMSTSKQSQEIIDWRGKGKALRAIFASGDSWGPAEKRKLFIGNPFTAKLEQSPEPYKAPDRTLSPDNKYRAQLKGKQLQIITTGGPTDGKNKRTFTFHPDDQRFIEEESAISWASKRYLLLTTSRPSFIDIETLKMNYPVEPSKDHFSLTFSPDFKWVVSGSRDGHKLGKIVIR